MSVGFARGAGRVSKCHSWPDSLSLQLLDVTSVLQSRYGGSSCAGAPSEHWLARSLHRKVDKIEGVARFCHPFQEQFLTRAFKILEAGTTSWPGSQKKTVETLWRQLFSDPSQWWDHRSEKVNAKHPDFKHKKTGDALWLDGKLNPPWVAASLARVTPGTMQADTFAWNARLARLVKSGQYVKTMELFRKMQAEGMHPDRFTFVHVLKACAGLQALDEGRAIHSQITRSGCLLDLYVASSLLGLYVNCGRMADAWKVFNKMATRNAVAWNIMIMGLVNCGQGHKALEVFQRMQREGNDPDEFTFVAALNACAGVAALAEGQRLHEQIVQRGWDSNIFLISSLVDMYAKNGSIPTAWSLFKEMPVRDVVAWSTMIHGFARSGQGREALELAEQMQQQGIQPDPVTYVGILLACGSLALLDEGRRIHGQINQRGYDSDVYVGSSLIDMYVKCGGIEDAQRVFHTLPKRDVVSCNIMILGFVEYGLSAKALDLFRGMKHEGLEPVAATFVGVLSGCGRLRLLEEGRQAHGEIAQRGWESDVRVRASLIDMYSKCGSIDEARGVFDKMPCLNPVIWDAMIQAHVKCGQPQKAMELYERQREVELETDPLPSLNT